MTTNYDRPSEQASRSIWSPAPIIPQQMLQDLKEARRQKDYADGRAKAIRNEILNLLQDDARVESGPLVVRHEQRPVYHITLDTIRSVLGEQQADRVKEYVSLRRTDYVYIDDLRLERT
jgi:hypothetical protein